ncbi:uncharacterized protein [Venturia canescens]|uniref:uncharacterized protein n=1 Tax=Venturia canescens TaxID=32260 RepID=UPI001C9C7AA4|nr:uncharacterized protein LOC122405790 [Venturia canescens]
MWKILRSNARAVTRSHYVQKLNRTFLSEAYRCTDAWNKRLESPILSKINPDEFFIELDKKFQSSGRASAVDVDIYSNIVTNIDHVEGLLNILTKLRLTSEASNILDSTHHAVIRYLFDNNNIDDLLTVLNDRINYGIFPDYLCYNILMDTFIKRQDYASAARVAVLLMLQEDSSNPISNALALYSCLKYLENPESWKAPEPEPEEDPKGEEIKVRVQFIRNPFFDDHFDLTDPQDLVGKTLVFYGKASNDVVSRSCHLRGLVLWKKYKDASNLIKQWTDNNQNECIYEEVLAQVQQHLSHIPEDKITDEVKELNELLNKLDRSNLAKGSVLEEIEKRVREAVKTHEETDISETYKIYDDWEKTRISLLQAQIDELDKKSRLEKVDEMKKELQLRERFLTFFENKKTIELQIEQKIIMENRKYGPKLRVAEDIDDNYIPPVIKKERRN